MAVDTGIGQFETGFLKFCVKGSNVAASTCNVMLVGPMSTDGTATANQPVQILSVGQAETLFGARSPLAEMVRRARAINSGGLYATPVAPTGTAAEFTLTPVIDGGGLLNNGTIELEVQGRTFTAVVTTADTATQIGQALADAFNADNTFGYTATNAGGVVTLVSNVAGVIGNQLSFRSIETDVSGLTVAAPTQTVVGAGSLSVADAISAWGQCCFDCIAYGDTDTTNANLLIDYAEQSFACGSSQCFAQVYFAQLDNAANHVVAANARNDRAGVYIPLPQSFEWTSAQIASAIATRACQAGCDDPGRPIVRDNGILTDITGPSDCFNGSVWTDDEKEAMAVAGALIWDYAASGTAQIELAITPWKTGDNGSSDTTWRQIETRHVVKDLVDGLTGFIETNYSSVKLFTNGTRLPTGSRATTPNILKSEIVAFLQAEVGVTLDASDLNTLVQVEANENDPNRIDLCADLSLVNQLLRIAACINVDVTNQFAS